MGTKILLYQLIHLRPLFRDGFEALRYRQVVNNEAWVREQFGLGEHLHSTEEFQTSEPRES